MPEFVHLDPFTPITGNALRHKKNAQRDIPGLSILVFDAQEIEKLSWIEVLNGHSGPVVFKKSEPPSLRQNSSRQMTARQRPYHPTRFVWHL